MNTTANGVCTSVHHDTPDPVPYARTLQARRDTPQVRRARAAILRIGELLHGSREDVIVFAEAVTGVSWDVCDQGDLLAVLAEYRAMFQAIEDKQARCIARSQVRAMKGAHDA